jgi:hypothetical protein
VTAVPTNLTAISDMPAKAVIIRRNHRSTSSDPAVIIRRKPRSRSVGIHIFLGIVALGIIKAFNVPTEKPAPPYGVAKGCRRPHDNGKGRSFHTVPENDACIVLPRS